MICEYHGVVTLPYERLNVRKLTIIANKRAGKRTTLQTKIAVNDLYDATPQISLFGYLAC